MNGICSVQKLLFQQQGFDVLPASVGEGITPDSYGLNMMHFIPQGGAITKKYAITQRVDWILERALKCGQKSQIR